MLEVVFNGEKLCNAQFNDSLSKHLYSFSKSSRFHQFKPSFNTEFNYEVAFDLAKPSKNQKQLIETKKAVKPPFNNSGCRIQKPFMPCAPSSDTYNPQLLPKTKYCTFGFGREVS